MYTDIRSYTLPGTPPPTGNPIGIGYPWGGAWETCVFLCHMYHYNSICVYIYINTIKYYTVQVTNLYTDASDSQDNHTKVYNIIRMQMTPKIITIRYIKRYKIL